MISPFRSDPLGEFAIKLDADGLFIHGTNRPYSIGMQVSRGCLRLYPEDIRSLVYQVPKGTLVRIVDQAYKLGKENGVLFLEAHTPISRKEVEGENLTPVIRGVVKAGVGRLTPLEWDRILAEARRLEDMEKHEHFHHVVDYTQVPDDKRSVCAICHSDYPHKKNKGIRALMNMHTQYFACETCHIKERVGTSIVYRWYSPFSEDPKGPFFGTRYDAKTGKLVAGDPFSKIAPNFKYDRMVPSSLTLAKTDDIWSPLQTQNTPMARDFMKVRDKLSPEQREGIKNQFHENTNPKGHDCRKCHAEKSIFDYVGLGFSEKRARDLTHLEVAGMIAKYEEFYLPELFGEAVKKTSKEGQ